MKKTFNFICKILALEALAFTDGKASLSEEQINKIEDAIVDREADLTAKVQALEGRDKTVADLETKITALEEEIASLKKEPATSSAQVVNNHNGSIPAKEKTVEEEYIDTLNSANSLYNMLS